MKCLPEVQYVVYYDCTIKSYKFKWQLLNLKFKHYLRFKKTKIQKANNIITRKMMEFRNPKFLKVHADPWEIVRRPPWGHDPQVENRWST